MSKHRCYGSLAMVALLALQPAGAAELSAVAVVDGFKELFSYAASPFLLGGAWMAVKITLLAMSIGLVYEVSKMRNAEYRPIPAIWGHLAGGAGLNPVGAKFVNAALVDLLER